MVSGGAADPQAGYGCGVCGGRASAHTGPNKLDQEGNREEWPDGRAMGDGSAAHGFDFVQWFNLTSAIRGVLAVPLFHEKSAQPMSSANIMRNDGRGLCPAEAPLGARSAAAKAIGNRFIRNGLRY